MERLFWIIRGGPVKSEKFLKAEKGERNRSQSDVIWERLHQPPARALKMQGRDQEPSDVGHLAAGAGKEHVLH